MNQHLALSSSVITPKSVQQALKSLVYTTVTQYNSNLCTLALVEKFLQSLRLQSSLSSRSYALGCILTNIITEQTMRLLTVLEGNANIAQETYCQATLTIQYSAQTVNPELIGWCWVYYRYVRPELHISVNSFSELCTITQRTLSRYHSSTINRLTTLLIERELQVKSDQSKYDDPFWYG